MAPSVGQLEHWTLVTRDVEQSKRFYTEVLGATPIDRDWPPSVRMGGVTIDLFAANAEQFPEPGTLGQHHAYRIQADDYDQWIDHLKTKGVAYRMASHGARRMSIYVDDPDGYHLELTCAFGSDEEGRREIEKRGITRYTNSAGPQVRGV
jgi:catechol 2,3-dioxygenase-like lactoylglutathione lyase family enzyme